MVSNSEHEEMKIAHRDLERERRKEMASLLTDLQSLLPLDFVKGRRTRADIVDEAVDYIENLKRKINDLNAKRDELKRLHLDYSSSSNLCSSSCVVMNYPYSGGLKIVISSLQLSRVMKVLVEESIEVETCASTKINEEMFHTILTKVDDSRRIDLHELQQKLYHVCNYEPLGA